MTPMDEATQAMLDLMGLHEHTASQFDKARRLLEVALVSLGEPPSDPSRHQIVVKYRPRWMSWRLHHWLLDHLIDVVRAEEESNEE